MDAKNKKLSVNNSLDHRIPDAVWARRCADHTFSFSDPFYRSTSRHFMESNTAAAILDVSEEGLLRKETRRFSSPMREADNP
jgi:hypothetical protein